MGSGQRDTVNCLEVYSSGYSLEAQEETEQLVLELKRVWCRSAVSTLVEVGGLIVRHCYGGDIEAWRHRGANAPLRRLEQHSRLPFSRKTVYLALHFYDLSMRLEGQPFLHELGVGHLRAVLGLPGSEQERLLNAAIAGSWTIAELTKEAAAARRLSGRRTGRPPAPEGVRATRRLLQHVDALEQLLSDDSLIERCSPERLLRLRTRLADIKVELAELG